jgi:DNA repair exonuclease SbcCD ATPase subunit
VAILSALLQERDNELQSLREQLRDSEREASWLREANKLRAQEEQLVPPPPVSADGDHIELQAALEAAWQDLQDARNRSATLEEERDAAMREVDELRIELYGKLETAKDEAIAAENRLTEQQHAFDDARETWVSDHAQLRAELEGAQLVLHEQVQEISQLRQSMIPQVHTSAAMMEELPGHSYAGAEPVPLVNPSTFPGAPALPRPHYTAHRPDTEHTSMQSRSLSSLVGFETSPPAITEDTPDEFAAGKAFRKPTKSFGFGRLFRSS